MAIPKPTPLIIGLTISLAITACSRSEEETQNSLAVVETVDPMTNETGPSSGTNAAIGESGRMDTGGNMGPVPDTTGSLPTDATSTMTGTNSSGPSDTRGTRGEGMTRPNTERTPTPPPG